MWSSNRHITIEEQSYRKLVQQYNPLLFSIISKKIKSREDVKDVFQNVHIHLWNYRAKLDGGNAEAIIINTCTQKIAEFYRKNANIKNAEVPIEETVNIYDKDSSLAEQKEQHLVLIEEAMEKLIPPIRKIIFKMNKLDGITQEKIATHLNMSRRTVKFHIEESLLYIKRHVDIHKNS